MFPLSQQIRYQHQSEGTWGVFNSPAGNVLFLQTIARLGKLGRDNESRLTKLLCPVREVLDIRGMDFDQLLQRDLDDHRVAVDLLPYVLTPQTSGPAFFPPIVAALLPFQAQSPIDHFPKEEDVGVVTDEEFGGMQVREFRCGGAYSFRKLCGKDGADHPRRLGKLLWNDEESKLVVLDGQHRAMALIAIHRTLNGAWSGSTGEKYRHFYEHRVEKLLEEAPTNVTFEGIEYPVTICLFPQLTGPDHYPHLAARKLFVDVNKNARAPSNARLTLLSDTELVNIFTRSLLNEMRSGNWATKLPIYSVEYDNPNQSSSRPIRWSALASLDMLKNAVLRTVFGPDEFVEQVDEKINRGNPGSRKMQRFFQRQLRVSEVFDGDVIHDEEDGAFPVSDLSDDAFPRTAIAPLVKRFLDTWGKAILTITANLEPYAAHVRALKTLRDNWSTAGTVGQLSRDAIFDGVGVFWTLRDSHRHWRSQVEEAKEKKLPPPATPEIVKAWWALKTSDRPGNLSDSESKEDEFRHLRAREYLALSTGRVTPDPKDEEVDAANDFYRRANTHACHLGICLAVASIAHELKLAPSEVPPLAEDLVSAWNAGLAGGGRTYGRRLFLNQTSHLHSPHQKNPFNLIRKMDSPLAVYFRYFWLELLASEEAVAVLQPARDESVILTIRTLRDKSRRLYRSYLLALQEKDLRNAHREWDKEKIKKEAIKGTDKTLAAALRTWFGENRETYDAWIHNDSAQASGTEVSPSLIDLGEDNGDDDDHLDMSYPDLLSTDFQTPDAKESPPGSPVEEDES